MDLYNAEFNDLLVTAYKSVIKVEELILQDMSNSDLSISEMHMLESIGKDPSAGMTIGGIAQALGITLPSVTIQVQKLEKKGYVTKERNAFDARSVHVKPTEKGRRAEVAHRYFHRQMVRAITKGMDENERVALMQGLTKLNAFLTDKIESRQWEGVKGEQQ